MFAGVVLVEVVQNAHRRRQKSSALAHGIISEGFL
jgi:hypothetical protein